MKTIINGIKNENPTFILLLGLCPALAVTSKFETAYIMGLCVLVILIISNLFVSLTKKIVPDSVRIPVYILVIATLVTAVEMLLNNYVPSLYRALGIYLPLIVVNCIVLGRNLAVAVKENIKKSILDAIGIGIGFTLALMLIALIREVLGSNTLTIMDSLSELTGYRAVYKILPTTDFLPIKFLSTPAGAFMTVGFLIALFNRRKHESN